MHSNATCVHLTATLQVELELGDGHPPLRSHDIRIDSDSQGSFLAPVAQLIVRLAHQVLCECNKSASSLPPEFRTQENLKRRAGDADSFPAANEDAEPTADDPDDGASGSGADNSPAVPNPLPPALPCGRLVPEGPFCLAVRELAETRGNLEVLPFVEPCHSQGSAETASFATQAARDGYFWCLRVRPTNFIDAMCGHWLQCFLCCIAEGKQHKPFFKKMPLEAFDRIARSLGWAELVQMLPSDECCRASFCGMNCVQVLQLLQTHFESFEREVPPSRAQRTGFHAGVLCGSECGRGVSRLCVVPLSSGDTPDVLRQQVALAGGPHFTGMPQSSASCNCQSVVVLAEPRDMGAHGEPASTHGQVLVDDRPVAGQLWQKESGLDDLRKLGSDGRKSLSEWRNEREPLPQGAHWEDPPLLQVVEHRSSSSSASASSTGVQLPMVDLIALRRALREEWKLIPAAQTVEAVPSTMLVLSQANQLTDPLGALSIDGLSLAARAVGAPGCPELLRETAADCLCRAFAETRLRGRLLEGVVQTSKVRWGLAGAIALAAQPPQEHLERRRRMANSCFGLAGAILSVRQPPQQSACRNLRSTRLLVQQERDPLSAEESLKQRMESLEQHRRQIGNCSARALVSWRSHRLCQRPDPAWVEFGSMSPSHRTLTQATMALRNLHSHLSGERLMPEEIELLIEDLRVLARGARRRAAHLQEVLQKDTADGQSLLDAKEEAFLYQVLTRSCSDAEDAMRRSMAPRLPEASRYSTPSLLVPLQPQQLVGTTPLTAAT